MRSILLLSLTEYVSGLLLKHTSLLSLASHLEIRKELLIILVLESSWRIHYDCKRRGVNSYLTCVIPLEMPALSFAYIYGVR